MKANSVSLLVWAAQTAFLVVLSVWLAFDVLSSDPAGGGPSLHGIVVLLVVFCFFGYWIEWAFKTCVLASKIFPMKSEGTES